MKPQIYEEWIVEKRGDKIEKFRLSDRGSVSIHEHEAEHNNAWIDSAFNGQRGLMYELKETIKNDSKQKTEKPLSKMNREELLTKAIGLEIEIEDSLTKKQLIEKIEDKLKL